MTRHNYYHIGYSCKGKEEDGEWKEYVSDTEYVELMRERETEKKKEESED